MKIAYDAKRFFHNSSGLGNYSRDLVRIMADFSPENNYLLFNKNTSDKGKEILAKPNVSFIKSEKSLFSRQLKMGIEAQNTDADIFHGLSGELPIRWNNKNIKKIVTIHDLIFMRHPQFYSFFDRKIHYWKFKKATETADLIIAISEQTKKDIIQFLKTPPEKIRVVYQGCHATFKEDLNAEFKNKIKKKFNLPEKFILNVGTIEQRKNLLNVVKALKGSSIPLVVVGKKTDYYKKVKQEIEQNQQQVTFLKNVTMQELSTIYKLATIFIYPSLFEGFGIPIIEALFSKTPVITSHLSCLPEAGGEHSLYINPYDVEDIKNKILFLWDNKIAREQQAEESFKFVQQFNDAIIAENLMNVYKEALDL